MGEQEYFLELDGGAHNLSDVLGRIILTPLGKKASAEIDLVARESRKILRHIAIIYKDVPLELDPEGRKEFQDIFLNEAVAHLADFIRPKY